MITKLSFSCSYPRLVHFPSSWRISASCSWVHCDLLELWVCLCFINTVYCWICVVRPPNSNTIMKPGTRLQCRMETYRCCLVTCFVQIFSRYEKHRDLILEDIFASLRRLPTTKRNLRSFKWVNSILRTILCFVDWFNVCHRLSSGQHIQMMTALILQLVQCIVVSPKSCSCEASPHEQEGQQKEVNVRMTHCMVFYPLANQCI